MVEICKHCGKDIKDLKPTQKGQHIANCVMNPNFKITAEKRVRFIRRRAEHLAMSARGRRRAADL